jgi:aldehyde dehydrogenase (NAD+)
MRWSALASRLSRAVLGDPFDGATTMGPVASLQQRDRVEQAVATGVQDGSRLVLGGTRPDCRNGYFVSPTLFSEVQPGAQVAQTEIFGPVLSVIPAPDEQAMVAIANSTIYGLNSSVFTNDLGRAAEAIRGLRSGTVGCNGIWGNVGIGFGGFKQSGIGRKGGREGLKPYLEAKTVVVPDDLAGVV